MLNPTIEYSTADGSKEFFPQSILLKKGNIFLFGDITQETLHAFTTQLFVLMDQQEEINIYLNSNGGEVLSGLAIYDLIRQYKDKINIYCIGIAASMGAIILSAGEKGRRFIYPHSKVMIHEPLLGGNLSNKSASSIQTTAESILETKELLIKILTERTENEEDVVRKAISFDNYMTAEEALDFHIVDKIL